MGVNTGLTAMLEMKRKMLNTKLEENFIFDWIVEPFPLELGDAY